MPTFYDAHNAHVQFDNKDVERWLRRLRILYQIDKGRYYGEVIDYLLSIFQFIPANLLLPLVHITMETYATDEIMINDIARARMFVLEEWAADGDPHRSVCLTESYRTMSPNSLVAAQQQIKVNEENSSAQSTVITFADHEEPVTINNLNIHD
jgi:hypothetical protein